MAEAIKVIETRYNGYRFRSRLEARWAVFFDALEVRYRYEVEGFDTGCGWYLPDFFLSDLSCYVETKPTVVSITDDPRWVSLASTHPLMLICGEPWANAHTCTVINSSGHVDFYLEPLRCCGRVAIREFKPLDNPPLILINEHARNPSSLEAAYVAARSARFEFDEADR